MSLQKCPKCDGQGIVSKPPYIAGDVYEWSSASTSFTCNVCNGAKTIWAGDFELQSALAAKEAECERLKGERDKLQSHDWYCACDHWNGASLAVCAMCGRTPSESIDISYL